MRAVFPDRLNRSRIMRVFPDQKNGGQFALPAIGFKVFVEVSLV
jgi:hypothetical protein